MSFEVIKQYANTIKIVVGVILIVGIGLYVSDLKSTISEHKDTITQLQLDNAHKDIELVKCKNYVDKLNIQIEQFKKDSINNQDIIDRLDSIINDTATRNDEILDRLRDIPTPETCDELSKFVRENIGDLKWPKQ